MKCATFLIFLSIIILVSTEIQLSYGQESPNETLTEQVKGIKQAIEQSNTENEKLFWISFIVALTAIGGTIFSSIIMQRNNKSISKDIDSRIRPIITRRNHPKYSSIFFKDKSLKMRFTNVGALPALNIHTSYYIENKTKDNPLKKEFRLLDSNISGLSINEVYRKSIQLNDIHLKTATQSSSCYFGIRIDYYDNSKRNYHYLFEGHFDKGITKFDNVDAN